MNIIENYKNIPFTYVIDSWKPGKNIILIGATHGNEPSGYLSNLQLLEDFQNKSLTLNEGKLIIVTKANYKAFEKNERCIDIDLNRVISKDFIGKKWFEYERAKEIMTLLDESDYLLDLHSTSGKSEPFLFSEEYCLDIAKNLGVSDIVVGWADIWEKSILTDNEGYMHANGKTGFTLEAGSHDNKAWKEVCYKASLNFLSYFNNIDKKYIQKSEKLFMVKLNDVYIAQSDTVKYSKKNIENFDTFDKNSEIFSDGDFVMKSDKDLVVVMPTLEENIKKWDEVCFFWEKIEQ